MSIQRLSYTGLELDTAIAAVDGGLEFGAGEISSNGFFSRSQPDGRIVVKTNEIVKGAFRMCANITEIEAPNLLTVNDYICNGCSSLKSVSMPVATAGGYYSFAGCSALTDVYLPEQGGCSIGMFASCISLESIDLPKATWFGDAVFKGCSNLRVIILRSKTMCTCASAAVFNNTPFQGYNGLTGTAYVPMALIESYKTATNWSAMYEAGTCNFVAIEGSEYE